MPDSFFDSNVLLYVAGSDATKAARAETLIADGGMISVQVLNEITNVARRKMQLDWHDLHVPLDSFKSLLDVVALTVEIHAFGLAIAERYKLSTYDAMIAAAAFDAGCSTLWSEDMQDGFLIEDRLRIRNPFR